jgi:hypothetical protein
MTEPELLRLLDGEDDAALHVCADWLEGSGQLAAATLLRLEHRLRTGPRPRDLLALGEHAAELANKTPAPWLAALARRSPVGEWRGHDNDREPWRFHYLATGKLHYANTQDTHKDGVWKQVGSLLLMSTNKKFTRYVGLLAADRIVGAARTIHDLAWTWEVTPVESALRPKLRGRRPDKARRLELRRAVPKATDTTKPARKKQPAPKPARKKPAATARRTSRAPSSTRR